MYSTNNTDRICLPILTKAEKTKIVGTRVSQLDQNAPTLVTSIPNEKELTPYKIACYELYLSTKKSDPKEDDKCRTLRTEIIKHHNPTLTKKQIAQYHSILPIKVIKKLPNGKEEKWCLNELIDPDSLIISY